MKSRILGVVSAAAIVSLSASSCVSNDGSVIIIGVLAPPISTGSGGSAQCVYTANIIGPFISTGILDIAFSQEYQPELLLGNQLVAVGNAPLDRVETDNIVVQGAIVRVVDASGAQLDNYTVPGDGFIPASTGGTPGLSTFGTTIISPTAISALGTVGYGITRRLVSYVKVFGTTTGGTHIESGEVGVPVNVCNGCLVSFPAEANDPAQNPQPNCKLTGQSGSSVAAPCVYGQDQAIDCRLCGQNPACDPLR
ncbi:MAG TPA: hypothetical protein VGH28_29560 [Polyangiaceae bacterium]